MSADESPKQVAAGGQEAPRAKPTVSLSPELLALRDRSRARPERGCRRVAGCGGVVLVVVLALALAGEYAFLKRGVVGMAGKMRTRLEREAVWSVRPDEISALGDALDAYFELAAAVPEDERIDWYGAFVGRAGRVLRDDRVSRDEVAAMRAFLLEAVASGQPAPLAEETDDR